jgi:hypothetical protein
MRTISPFLVAGFLLQAGCQETSAPPPPTQDELLTRAVIAGSSTDPDNYSVFRSDGTFQRIIKTWHSPPQAPDTLTLTTSGRFRVENAILYQHDVQWSYTTQSGTPRGFANVIYPVALEMQGSTLRKTIVEVFGNNGVPRAELSGSWTSVLWQYVASDSSFTPWYSGRAVHSYTFTSGSTQVDEYWSYPDGSFQPSTHWVTSYTYNPPILRIGLTEPVRLVFSNALMILFHDQQQPEMLPNQRLNLTELVDSVTGRLTARSRICH